MRTSNIQTKNKRYISPKTRFEVFKRDGYRCQYCGRTAENGVLQIDHLIAVTHGGESDIGNLITACSECNGGKSSTEILGQSRHETIGSSTVKPDEVSKQIQNHLNSLQFKLDLLYHDHDRMAGFYLFCWDDVPGQDNKRLIEFLYRSYFDFPIRSINENRDDTRALVREQQLKNLEWLRTAQIDKINDGNTIKIHSNNRYILLNLNETKTKVGMKWDSSMTIEVTDSAALRFLEKSRIDHIDEFREFQCRQCNNKAECPIKGLGDSDKCEKFKWAITHVYLRPDEECLFDAKNKNGKLRIYGSEQTQAGVEGRNDLINWTRNEAIRLAALIQMLMNTEAHQCP